VTNLQPVRLGFVVRRHWELAQAPAVGSGSSVASGEVAITTEATEITEITEKNSFSGSVYSVVDFD
jgi:hypothetical protein